MTQALIRGAALVVALAAGGAAASACASTPSASAASASTAACGGSAPKLTVQGTGMATGTPDLLTMTVGIDVTDSSAHAAMADNNTKAAAVTAAFTAGGVAAKDVQTSDLSVQPSYNSNNVITGYDVTNTITAQLRDFATAGSVIDAVAAAAGNAVRIDSLSFSVEDPRTLEDAARHDAVGQAVSHAQAMATAAGERLGPVCALTDDTQATVTPQPYPFGAAAGSIAAPSVPLEPGSQQESDQVTMVYALRPAP